MSAYARAMGMAQAMASGPKKVRREQVTALIEQLGHNPDDVVQIIINATTVCVRRLGRDRSGEPLQDPVFGPILCDLYHPIDESNEWGVPEPPADATSP